MTILPIQSVDHSDQPQVGREIYQLGALKRAGYPVPLGWAIIPPQAAKWKDVDRRSFEHKAKVLKKEWLQTKIPNDLAELLNNNQKLFFRGTVFSSHELWTVLLEHWFGQLQSYIHRHDSLPANLSLTPEVLWQLKGEGDLVSAVFDPGHTDIRIDSSVKMAPKIMQKIDQLVKKADKKLFMTYKYTFWIEKGEVYLIRIQPSSEVVLPHHVEVQNVASPVSTKAAARSVVKVVLELQDQAYLTHSVDGVMVGLNDLEQLVIVSQAMSEHPVFAQLDGQANPDIEGSLGLIHHKLVLEKNCRNFLLSHQKEGFNNIRLVLPVTKSVAISVQLKKQLSDLGISRRGSMEFWQMMALPENILQIEKYIDIGMDGAILDLDRIYHQLTGISDGEKAYYAVDWVLLTQFLAPALTKLKSAQISVMVRGKLALFAEILEFLVHAGVWGVVVPKIEAEGLTEHLYWTEKKVIKQREAGRIPL